MLLGREREQAWLRQVRDAALGGNSRLVLLSGEAGIGKTTLVEWLAGEADMSGWIVLWSHAYDLSVTPPYGPWLEVLRHSEAADPGATLPAFLDDQEALAALGGPQ